MDPLTITGIVFGAIGVICVIMMIVIEIYMCKK
jgi:hypothetical protein